MSQLRDSLFLILRTAMLRNDFVARLGARSASVPFVSYSGTARLRCTHGEA